LRLETLPIHSANVFGPCQPSTNCLSPSIDSSSPAVRKLAAGKKIINFIAKPLSGNYTRSSSAVSSLIGMATTSSGSGAGAAAATSPTGGGRRPATGDVLGTALQVNWEDYNYPPLLRVIHYNLHDVESADGRAAVRLAFVSLNVMYVSLVLNVIGTATLAGFHVPGKGVQTLYSIFNAVIMSMLGLYSFYHCYKGVATQNSRLLKRFFISYPLVGAFSLISAVAGFVNFNGWLAILRATETTGSLRVFWVNWSAVEASFWTTNCVLELVVFLQTKRQVAQEGIGSFVQMNGLYHR